MKSHFAGEAGDITSNTETADEYTLREHRIDRAKIKGELLIAAVAVCVLLLYSLDSAPTLSPQATMVAAKTPVQIPTHGVVLHGGQRRIADTSDVP